MKLQAAIMIALVAFGVGPVLAQSVANRGAASDWLGVGGTADEASFSQLTQISTANIKTLGLVASTELEGEVSLEATPLAVGGILYFSGSYSGVYAVDGVTGKLLWKYDPQVWKVNPNKMGMGVNRGVAYDNGRIFIGVIDGRLVALNAKTGAVEWSAQTLPSFSFHNLTGAPRTFNGKVIIGNGGADIGQRGFVTAYDQVSGKQAWRFYTVPAKPGENENDPVMKMAENTWTGEYWKKGTGGTVWNGMTFDPELNRIYIGVGNAGPYNPAVRNPGGGDNLFVGSIVALDADTGKYIWHYQQNPNESWDYKATPNMIVSELVIDGKSRKVLMQAPTNGFFYVLDRETGKLISAEKTGKVTWADHIDLATGRPVEAADIRYQKGDVTLWPGTLGAHNWQAMSFSPKTGLVYIPYMQMNTRYSTKLKDDDFPYMGVGLSFAKGADPGDGKGALIAWDPVAQKARWRVERPYLWNGGTMVTAANLVFQGTADGFFTAHDAASGEQLWRFNAGHGIIGAPMSWSKGGRQYVSILSGWGGTAGAASDVLDVGWKYGQQPRRLLTFALGGKMKLPKMPGRDMVVHAVDDPSIMLDDADVAKGRGLTFMCMACHGRNFRGGGAPGPDLRESTLALSEDNLWEVVNGGALLERGMPTYKHLSREQIHQLWSALRAAAREAQGIRSAKN
jgi:quinohemoprotein ethanol dehydrogenase